jgi:hypothetical protein
VITRGNKGNISRVEGTYKTKRSRLYSPTQ